MRLFATKPSRPIRRRLLRLAAAGLTAVAVAACAASGEDPVRGAAQLTGFATTVGEPKPFVAATRPDHLDYLPVGVTPGNRDIRPKTARELSAYERSLEAKRISSQRRASRPPPKFPVLQQPRQLPPVPAGRATEEQPGTSTGD